MSSIPYNYGSYIDAKVSMTDTGHVSASKQIQSPASAGSRGLAKTQQFTNNPTQMTLGQSEGMTPMAESMVEIRSILNRIDGVNAPVQEDAGEKIANMAQNMTKDQFMSHADDLGLTPEEAAEHYEKMQGGAHVQEEVAEGKILSMLSDLRDALMDNTTISDNAKTSIFTALDQIEDDMTMESYQPMPEGDEFDIEEDEDFEEVLGPLGFPEDETELFDAEYQGRKVPLNKPMRGDVKKFKVYVKDPKTGNVKKVNFGHGGTSAKRPTMRIRKSNPKARKSFRARHNCANPGPKTKARYWSCRKW